MDEEGKRRFLFGAERYLQLDSAALYEVAGRFYLLELTGDEAPGVRERKTYFVALREEDLESLREVLG